MEPEQLQLLAGRYVNGTATEQEAQTLHDWYDRLREGDTELVSADPFPDATTLRTAMLHNIEQAIRAATPAPVIGRPAAYTRNRWQLAAAAAIVLLLAGAAYFLLKPISGKEVSVQQPVQDIAPGHAGAILTLSNGSTIVLDSAVNGAVAQEGNIQVIKTDGQLQYNNSTSGTTVAWNTLATPVGRQYQVVLPDGTHAWLNAASSLRYPTSFQGKERKVVLTGEAYFEVAAHKELPFKVEVQQMEVAVLGTHFNINAYNNEASIKTTLLEGKVQVSQGAQSQLLAPGQQAVLAADGKLQLVKEADMQQAVAWKAGIFQFNHADLGTVLRELTRWYDVEIRYKGKPPAVDFGGAIGRDLTLAQVLKILQQSQVRFRIEGKTLVVEAP